MTTVSASEPDRRAESRGQIPRSQHLPALSAGEALSFLENHHVGEYGRDFLDVMGDEDQRGAPLPSTKLVYEAEKPLPRHRIETGARLVENQASQGIHQGTANENPLALSLRQQSPFAVGEMEGVDFPQISVRPLPVVRGDCSPVVDHRLPAR